MGIHDRDYARRTPASRGRRAGISNPAGNFGGGGPSSFFARGYAVTRWLIIINVAIFALNRMSGPATYIHIGDVYAEGFTPTPGKALQKGPTPLLIPKSKGSWGYPLIDPTTGAHVGYSRVFPSRMHPIEKFGHLSTGKLLRLEVWRLITFQFLHADTTHLLFNMVGLWFFGPLVESWFKSRRMFLAFYFMCGICGALLYLLLNLAGYTVEQLGGPRLPLLLVNDIYTPLIGASAGVFGVLLACAYVAPPNAVMYLFMVIPLKVRTGAYLLALVAFINLVRNSSNAGGEAAHVGGALAGFYFIRHPALLRDFFSILSPPKDSPPRKGTPKRKQPRTQKQNPTDAEVDRILKKVSREGTDSITPNEHRLLEQAATNKRTPNPPTT